MTRLKLWPVFSISIAAALVLCAAILALEPHLSQITLLPDQGASWYYWKLPEPTTASRLSAWGLYTAHQLFFWGLIFWAKKHREEMKDRRKLHPINIVGLIGMGVFSLLHYLQTAVWYDGLAQDTSIWASQASVVLLLIVVLMIEAPRRGLFFGYAGGWLQGTRQVLIRTHGYYFAWAITFTFWYHPMETTLGHVIGFAYMFFLMIQGALVFTSVHTNRVWTLILEVSVLFHGVTVALVAGQEFWPMFFFGFAAMFIVTQMHGMGWSRGLRGLLGAAFLVGVFFVYTDRGWANLNEIIRIPVIDYLGVGLLGGLTLLAVRLMGRKT